MSLKRLSNSLSTYAWSCLKMLDMCYAEPQHNINRLPFPVAYALSHVADHRRTRRSCATSPALRIGAAPRIPVLRPTRSADATAHDDDQRLYDDEMRLWLLMTAVLISHRRRKCPRCRGKGAQRTCEYAASEPATLTDHGISRAPSAMIRTFALRLE